MATKRIRPLSQLIDKDAEMDSVAVACSNDNKKRAMDIILRAQRYWDNMSDFRKERERNKRYTYGKQWDDVISVDGKAMTEEQYIYSQGSVPLKNNLIRRLVKNVIGTYRSQSKEPTCTARDRDEQRLGETMSITLQYNRQLNRMPQVDARSLEEFLISGLVVHRKSAGWRNGKFDCWTDYVQPNNFFIDNAMRDFRGWDCSFIGEIHDVSFPELCGTFAKSAEDYRCLKEIYKSCSRQDYIMNYYEQFGKSSLRNLDFMMSSELGLCRVIEVWKKESKPRYRCVDYLNGETFKINIEDYDYFITRENEKRIQQGMESGISEDEIPLIKAEWFLDNYWYYYYLSPFGDILDEGETPYAHGSHPYVFAIYPFIDGEVHSFVADVIDQQRYVNRLITLYDWIMRASAKGVLMFPEDALPDGMTKDDIAEEWATFNGVIFFKAKAGVQLPAQIANNCTNIGITELLNLQLKFFEDISGVNGALQGKPGYSGMSASLYAQQAQNGTTSLLDILETYSNFTIDASYKDVKNIQQFYDSKRIINIAGKNAVVEYDPEKIADVEFDLSVVESTNTPVYRQVANDFLMEIWKSGQISLIQMLKHGDFPFSDELIQELQSQQQQIEQGQVPQNLSPQALQQIQGSANMDAVNEAYNALRAA